MSEIRLPSLGAEMDEGTLLQWYVEPGDEIHYGQTIALLDTEKAEIEMEAYESGTIDALLIEPGQTVSVGEPIARIVSSETARGPASEAPPAPPPPTEAGDDAAPGPGDEQPGPRAEARDVQAPRPGGSEIDRSIGRTASTRIRATPLARRLAVERGLDLSRLTGSGPHGAIVEADIPPSTPLRSTPTSDSATGVPPSATTRASRRREIIAAAMTRSKREIPHYYLSTTVALGRAIAWLAERNQGCAASERVVLAALLIRAVALAAKDFPEMNGHWREDGFHASSAVHLGMVVSLRDGGLVVPTFRNADERPLTETMAELRDVVGRARAGRLRTRELSDATITLTSLGDDGVESIFGVIYPPQVAIVGFGGIHPALRAEGSLHGTQPVVRASLAADHRVSDGQRGSRFLQSISRRLHDPEQL
jgi:pyruvate dehydrogenase E2 component (dihydrolipoamide acetyltransferase)